MRFNFKGANEAIQQLLRPPKIFGPRQIQSRNQVSISSVTSNEAKQEAQSKAQRKELPTLSVMPSHLLMRSLLFTSVLSSPRLLNVCLPLMALMARSRSVILNPDKNRLLGGAMRILFYNQFCAGTDETEVKHTVAVMKGMGFKGVILGYAKDVVVDPTTSQEQTSRLPPEASHIGTMQLWRDGNLRTLSMIGSGDFLAIKFTGAGPAVTEALAMGHEPPSEFWQSLLNICDQAVKQDIRVWIDAEQQIFQPSIDSWTIKLMRHYNCKGKAQIYTTFQAYLKSTPLRIKQHLELAKNEDWVLGIKLVRGAYIASEPRHLIHDTKADTDDAYNTIAGNLLKRSFPGIPVNKFPQVQLFLASHNAYSVRKAYSLHRSLILAGKPTIVLEFGQLQGMADEVSCSLLKLCQKECFDAESTGLDPKMAAAVTPRAFKCLAWGSTRECMQFLVRRAVENRGCIERTNECLVGLRKEAWRRVRVVMKLEKSLG